MTSLVMDKLHPDGADKSILYDHSWALEGLFDQRAKAVAVLSDKSTFETYPGLVDRDKRELAKKKKPKSAFPSQQFETPGKRLEVQLARSGSAGPSLSSTFTKQRPQVDQPAWQLAQSRGGEGGGEGGRGDDGGE